MTQEDYQKNIATRPIRHFNINLTNQCNLRCYYCFAEHNPRNITWDTMKATIDFALNREDLGKQVRHYLLNDIAPRLKAELETEQEAIELVTEEEVSEEKTELSVE